MKKKLLCSILSATLISSLVLTGCESAQLPTSDTEDTAESDLEDDNASEDSSEDADASTDSSEADSSKDNAKAESSSDSEDDDKDKDSSDDDKKGSSEEADIEKCLEGYAEYLEEHTDLWENETVFVLDYINDDDVPDLIFGDTFAAHASNIYILSYLDGNYDDVVCSGPVGAYGATCYYPKLGIILTSNYGMGYDTEYYSKLSSEGEYGIETLCNRYFYFEEDGDEEASERKFFMGEDEEITEDEYDEYVKELVGDEEYTVFYTYENENGYDYLDQDAIDNLFNYQ